MTPIFAFRDVLFGTLSTLKTYRLRFDSLAVIKKAVFSKCVANEIGSEYSYGIEIYKALTTLSKYILYKFVKFGRILLEITNAHERTSKSAVN